METTTTKSSLEGQPSLVLENDYLSLTILPESGGEIVSFLNKTSGFDWAFSKPGRIRSRNYDDPYTESAAGFDELFPNIAPGTYTNHPWKGVPMPDKGEIWTTKPEVKNIDGGLRMIWTGVRFPYRFERDLRIDAAEIRFQYRLNNLSDFDFPFQWSVQPHFKLHEGDRLEVPEGTKLHVDFSFNEGINDNSRVHDWPIATSRSGDEVDLSIQHLDGGGEKLFLTDFPERKVTLVSEQTSQSCSFEFYGDQVNHCGIWIDRGAWPADDPDTLIAVGPATCLSDSFEVSQSKGALGTVAARGVAEWGMNIRFAAV